MILNFFPGCEQFDTYPRTYELLHATCIFSVEKKRLNMSTIMLEMDWMLRPGGRVYVRDSVSVMGELQEIATAMEWVLHYMKLVKVHIRENFNLRNVCDVLVG
ncbi:probable methyltransferase PMT12 [Durio zibethinus]|uniref:Methyltransferase n=1 Tax=Durio zibethinus TaxID=66656 RepID=A0A6P5ZL39_DURZI|nr:probable methyltransferase PMT12 [Durio zibethinus]